VGSPRETEEITFTDSSDSSASGSNKSSHKNCKNKDKPILVTDCENPLKGKTADEKKKLLKEQSELRQTQIHLNYFIEQQSLKSSMRQAI